MKYFKSEILSERVIRIIELGGVCCYLVIGDKKACLLDTGSGYGNIKEYVDTLTDKPVFVILSHAHYAHMGGAALFEDVYINLEDLPVFRKHGDMTTRYEEAQRIPETKTIPYSDMIPTRMKPMKGIKNGDIFDLGNVHIQMISVSGHTPGMMCPLIQEERTIIFGDACGVSVLLFDEYSSCVSEYLKSLEVLKTYENDYDTIYRNHGTFFSEKSLLDNVIECCHLILTNQDDHIPVEFHHYHLYAAKETNEFHRIDGKEGNILYSLDKAK